MTTRIVMTMAPCKRQKFNLSDMFPVPRLGLGYLATYIRHHCSDVDIELIDLMASRKWLPELREWLLATAPPDIFAISVTITSVKEAFEIAHCVKQVYPQTQVVVGGPGIAMPADVLFRHGTSVDHFVMAEGELAFKQIVDYVAHGGAVPSAPNASSRDEISSLLPPTEYRDLNDGLWCDYDIMPFDNYKLHPPMGIYPPATMMETARGCTFPCNFCALRMSSRMRSAEDVLKEAAFLKQKYKLREIHFVDPTFTLNGPRARQIAVGMGQLGLKWTCKTRVDTLTPQTIETFGKNGCYYIAFGVESGDDGQLGAIHKATTAHSALETFARCRQAGIRTAAYLMVATPGETDQSIKNTIKYVRKLEPDYVLYTVLQPDPSNELTHQYVKDGLFTWDDLYEYLLTDDPYNYFRHTHLGQHSHRQAKKWLLQATGDFYIRPKYFWKRARDMRSLQDAVNIADAVKQLMFDATGMTKTWR